MNPLRIIFMGTPEFAVPSLETLIENKINVVAVITAPDKPKGRGQQMMPSPVKECALRHHIPVLQPPNLKSPEFIEHLKGLKADLQIVVAFRMLPEVVWSMPPMGTFNLHTSLLPDYRGASPINWAIINGEKETGVTTFFLRHDIDTGNIIFRESEPIHDDDDAGRLYQRLMRKGAALVLKTVKAIESGSFSSVPQTDNSFPKHAPKIFRETCEIDWSKSSEEVINFVRGLSPYPTAWTTIKEKTFKIFKVSLVQSAKGEQPPKTLQTDNKSYLYVRAGDGWIAIEDLQAEGKRRMPIQEYFRGNKLQT